MLATTLLLALTTLVTAHFQINTPEWRANSFNAPYSQYTYPCAGVPEGLSVTNRTLWPLTGGSFNIDFHHPFTYVFLNLGLGSNVTNFNISLNAAGKVLNETGNGTLCVDKFTLPSSLSINEGQLASLQVSTVGPRGCADIQFSLNATLLAADQCANSTGVSWTYLNAEVNGSTATTTSSNATGTGAPNSETSKSAAAGLVSGMNLGGAGLVGLVMGMFVLGL